MIATIENYDAIAKGYVIVCRDEEGNTVERITVSEVIFCGSNGSWPMMELMNGNKIKLLG
jgi:hypothetical protein